VFQFRRVRQDVGDLVRVLPLVHERDEVGVAEQVSQFPLHITVVDVDRDRAQLVRREHRLQRLDGVSRVDTDM
jgi:hypothetical protein